MSACHTLFTVLHVLVHIYLHDLQYIATVYVTGPGKIGHVGENIPCHLTRPISILKCSISVL